MYKTVAFTLLLSTALLKAQAVKPGPEQPAVDQKTTVTYSTLIFSEPDISSPLQLSSAMMDGPASCSANGIAFFQFWTSTEKSNSIQKLDGKEIYSLSSRGGDKETIA